MKTKILFFNLFLIFLFGQSMTVFCQPYTQPASVVSLGGKSGASGNYSHFCVVGELVVKFNISSGQYSGSIGFLPNAGGNLPPVPILPEYLIEVFLGEEVTLDGSQSYDPDNDGITFEWLIPEEITIPDPTLPVVSFTAPTVNYKRMYEIALVVSDGMLTDTAWASVVVRNPEWIPVVYPNSTICIGRVKIDCEVPSLQYLLGAFVSNECRGVTDFIPYQGNVYVSFLIQGDVSNQQVDFKVVDTITDELYFVPQNPLAKTNPGGYLGTFGSPFPIDAFTIVNASVDIPAGWSGISSSVAPKDNNVVNMFLPVQQNLTLLYNFNGIYNPGQNINTLGTWQRDKGYVIKMANESTLDFAGYLPCSNSLSLSSQWSIMPVFSECEVNVSGLFAGQNLKIIKEVAGHRLYWPEFGINSLVNLNPKKSYYVYMNSTGTINFPDCPKSQILEPEIVEITNLTPWNDPVNTPNSHTIAIQKELLQPVLENGDFVGAFTREGTCIGMQPFDNENLGIIAYADDPATSEKEGYAETDQISLRVYKPDTREEFQLSVKWNQSLPQNDGLYHGFGMSAVSEITEITGINNPYLTEDEILIYPNPANDYLNIIVGELAGQTIKISNIQGQQVYSGYLKELHTKLDVSQFTKGVYFLTIVSEKQNWVEKVVIE